MKLVSYLNDKQKRLGLYYQNKIYDLKENGKQMNLSLPDNMNEFLTNNSAVLIEAKRVDEAVKNGKAQIFIHSDDNILLAPVPHPSSCRDAYAFRQHVATARRNRGADMIPEFDQFPIFYFTNHNAIYGPGNIFVEEDHLRKLDFELEAAIVIGRRGKNIAAIEADKYIAGYMIMNDLSARQLQMEEMRLNLGPAKGKDFATVIGPWLVTPDELEEYKIETGEGNKYNLQMSAYHNGEQISRGNMKDMNWTFAQIIERASYGVELIPGDVIGSGTVGTGCYLELNGTRSLNAKEKGESYNPVWLNDGDTIELEITGLGRLKNKIVKTNNKYSILEKKKQ